MYKNFKQMEWLRKKYTTTKTKLKNTKQELEEAKSAKADPVVFVADNTASK